MSKDLFKNKEDYWKVSENIRDIYLSEGSLATLLDFERVLDEMDLYAFRNWQIGELVQGPMQKAYTISCTFMWPETLMPDPRGARRLLPFDCNVTYQRREIEIPIKITDTGDYRPGTHKAKLIKKKVWLVEITMPKILMSDIRTGSLELEDQDIDLEELDNSYATDLDDQQYQDESDDNKQPLVQGQQSNAQPAIPTI
jgi:hypothetical protein